MEQLIFLPVHTKHEQSPHLPHFHGGVCVTEGRRRWPGGARCVNSGDDIQVPRQCLQGEISFKVGVFPGARQTSAVRKKGPSGREGMAALPGPLVYCLIPSPNNPLDFPHVYTTVFMLWDQEKGE